MKIVTPHEAVRAIPDDGVAVFPHGCIEPTAFYAAFQDEVERFHGLTVYSGLSFGTYPFLATGLGTHFRYVTWQAAPQIRGLFKENDPRKVGFAPMRLSEITRIVNRNGPIKPDAVVVQVSPPNQDGMVSLGISVGLYRDFIDTARTVIAEINANMPATHGNSLVPAEKIDLAFEIVLTRFGDQFSIVGFQIAQPRLPLLQFLSQLLTKCERDDTFEFQPDQEFRRVRI